MRESILIILLLSQIACISAPTYSGPKSDHFDGSTFQNTIPGKKKFWDFVKLSWGFLWDKTDWPNEVKSDYKQIKLNKDFSKVGVTFVNHSTFLIQFDQLKVLTDPIFSERASPFSWAGPKRVRKPGVAKEDLPDLDVIIISHNHYDHLDIESLKWLDQNKGSPLILVGLGVGQLLKEEGLNNVTEMDWGNSKLVDQLKFTFVECRHRSGRGLSDQMKTLWGSFVVESKAFKLYFAGDTGYGPHFLEANKRFGEFDLALLPIGAYEPRWFMEAVHLNPQQAVRAHLDLKSKNSIGTHFGTFQLTYEGLDRPIVDLSVSLQEAGVDNKSFLVPDFGETYFYER